VSTQLQLKINFKKYPGDNIQRSRERCSLLEVTASNCAPNPGKADLTFFIVVLIPALAVLGITPKQ
jgi:hypothetical protein